MAAFNSNDFPAPGLEQDTYAYRATVNPINTGYPFGPIRWTARFINNASNWRVYVQCDRSLASLTATTTAANYTMTGTSAPTVTGVHFNPGDNFLYLDLSGSIGTTSYTLTISDKTITDGLAEFNAVTPLAVFNDEELFGTGIEQDIVLGVPVMS